MDVFLGVFCVKVVIFVLSSKGSSLEQQCCSPEGLAEGKDGLPRGGCCHETAVAGGLDQ